MNILITGATGFLGSRLAESLINDGHNVYALVRQTSNLNILSEPLRNEIKIKVYDEKNTIMKIFDEIYRDDGKIDVVFHLASLYVTNHSYNNISELIRSNVLFGTELLEAMKKYGAVNFVNTGTSWQHYDNDQYNPVNLYAATKQAFEDILKFYIEASNFKVISLHLFDTYGPNDNRGKILNLFKKISKTGECLKMSPGEQKIDLVHVDDVINAFKLSGLYLYQKKYQYCGTYGVASGERVSLKELARKYEIICDCKLNIEWGEEYREREVMNPWSGYKILAGWRANVKLKDGINKYL